MLARSLLSVRHKIAMDLLSIFYMLDCCFKYVNWHLLWWKCCEQKSCWNAVFP